MLYILTEKDIAALDEFDGAPAYYHRISVEVYGSENDPQQAETYEVVNKEKEFQLPTLDYLEKFLSAAKKFSQ